MKTSSILSGKSIHNKVLDFCWNVYFPIISLKLSFGSRTHIGLNGILRSQKATSSDPLRVTPQMSLSTALMQGYFNLFHKQRGEEKWNGFFYILNKSAQVSQDKNALLVYMPSSGVLGAYGSSSPRFLRTLHAVLNSGCINSHSHQQCKRVSFFPHSL